MISFQKFIGEPSVSNRLPFGVFLLIGSVGDADRFPEHDPISSLIHSDVSISSGRGITDVGSSELERHINSGQSFCRNPLVVHLSWKARRDSFFFFIFFLSDDVVEYGDFLVALGFHAGGSVRVINQPLRLSLAKKKPSVKPESVGGRHVPRSAAGARNANNTNKIKK